MQNNTRDTVKHQKRTVASFNAIPLEELIAQIDREIGAKEETTPKEDLTAEQSVIARATSKRRQFIKFFLSDILLAISLSNALEIGTRPAITPLPNLPEWILGVSNIRGEIVSIVDLKGFFGLPSKGFKRDQRFIIIHNQEMKLGIVVDRVTGIFSPDHVEMDIQKSPYKEGEISSYISGVVTSEEKLLNIIDVDKLLTSSRMTAFRGE